MKETNMSGEAGREMTSEELMDELSSSRQRADGLASVAASERLKRLDAGRQVRLLERQLRQCEIAASGGKVNMAYYSDAVRTVEALKQVEREALARATSLEQMLKNAEQEVSSLKGSVRVLGDDLDWANARLIVANERLAERNRRANRSAKK